MSTLLVFGLAAGLIVAIPGPNHLYIVARSVGQGRRAGLVSAFGVETGTLVHIAAAALGISSIIATSAVAFSIVKYAGAAYLVYLGVRTLLRSVEPEAAPSTTPHPLGQVYREGILVNVLNPKVGLFFLAFLPQFVDTSRGSTAVQIVVLGVLMMLLGLASDVGYALAGGALGRLLSRHPRYRRRQHYATGCVYVGLGAAAALSGDPRR